MNPINLFTLTRVSEIDTFILFEKQLSRRNALLRIREHEINSICSLVETLHLCGAKFDFFDRFYFSYEIPQIAKEFDLLRINNDEIINIELKSRQVPEERIKTQLMRNRYYLSHLSRQIRLFTFIESSKTFYQLLDDNTLITIPVEFVMKIINEQIDCFSGDINTLFSVSNFLVSPLNTPDKFIRGEYFLTSQQEDIKKRIFDSIISKSSTFVGITGGPGTGKTLLLYDLAKGCSLIGKCCVIHCGILSDGHLELQKKMNTVDIVAAKDVKEDFDFSQYYCIFVDESHRFYERQFDIVVSQAISHNIFTIFSYDTDQTLSKTERNANISSRIEGLPSNQIYKLSSKIRTNKELASFIRRLLNLNSTDTHPDYPSVSVAFANNEDEAKALLRNYKRNGYIFINYTKSNFNNSTFDNYASHYNTHHVIGQEFDNVLMLLDDTFTYNDKGRLQGREHPNPNYLYRQLLFQGLTRVREKLAIIIIESRPLFESVLSILSNDLQ